MTTPIDETQTRESGTTVPKRINVAVTPETVQALQNVINQQGVSLTEALRRLVGYGDFVYRAIKDEHAQVLVQTKDSTREVVLL